MTNKKPTKIKEKNKQKTKQKTKKKTNKNPQQKTHMNIQLLFLSNQFMEN